MITPVANHNYPFSIFNYQIPLFPILNFQLSIKELSILTTNGRWSLVPSAEKR